MAANIFSTYSTGENRVTASILAVFQALSLSRIERLLGALLEQSEFELVRFENQPARGGEGVPDALILSSVRLLLETKTSRNMVGAPQLKRHSDGLFCLKPQFRDRVDFRLQDIRREVPPETFYLRWGKKGGGRSGKAGLPLDQFAHRFDA